MLNALSDLPAEEYPASKKLEMNDVLKDIKELLERHDNPALELQKYLSEVETKIDFENKRELDSVDKENVKSVIEKHPYFKNPSSYHIRLITIMKFLKKKGVDITIRDFDMLVDEIIMSIEGVEKIGYGKYRRRKY
ncbi:hypothetical protein [Fusibacter ferrireducens]|uniref:Uncharacterized protein n=1 Tax=Fusibacter ferrireducens TaxID=2785058 RepID=A0ABR9ZWQ9_9FIRM|nr:hypothetical protein [Fusibacter ferrireducens]MBF4694899.1 hypothetical protein [Fusibacter ferrireducens]